MKSSRSDDRPLSSGQIRERFLAFFEAQGHQIFPSSSLVPAGDPSLLFTNAGMVQFKSFFLGEAQPPYLKVATCQKCLRAGGKHNDLENVGHTNRHHTFFEMLGNFSFGDYFKDGAIRLAWEFLTQEIGLSADHLLVTIYEEDEEANSIWREGIGLPPEKIIRMGKADNFWAMGEVGPCGPCSEVVLDQGPEAGCGRPTCGVGCDCDRYLELWNLVFMQFSRDEEGTLTPLPRGCIDTGMGLERLAAVLQHVRGNYQSDLFQPVLEEVFEVSRKEYGSDPATDVSLRVVGDHARALAFLIADGVLPENEGRGYVLRRILRRAARHGRRLGISEPFLYRAALAVVDLMGPVYPELKTHADHIAWVIRGEEERFNITLDQGLKLLYDEVGLLRGRGLDCLPGEVAFKLYDTFGFPLDLTQDIAREEGFQVDLEGFDQAMAQQRERARRAFKGTATREEALWRELAQALPRTRFFGYESLEGQGKILAIIRGGEVVDEAGPGEDAEVVTDATPFYGEAGGQVGDRGSMESEGFRGEVVDAKRPQPEMVAHHVRPLEGRLRPGQVVTLKVDPSLRRATMANHTATHLLHAALRRTLGNHVKQGGSLVAPDRLRFDFTHYSRLNEQEIFLIEDLVNEAVRENIPVDSQTVPLGEAVSRGALAFFGEKYGEQVRTIRVGEISLELCGGTHVARTGDIGFFKVVSEGAVGAGVRRIEALTGAGAFQYLREMEARLKDIAEMVKATPGAIGADPAGVVAKVQALIQRSQALEREMESSRDRLALRQVDGVLQSLKEVAGVKVVAARVPARDQRELRDYGDKVRERVGSGIIALGAEAGGKALLMVMVTKDLIGRFDASDILGEASRVMGATGGGKREMAQAGGGDPATLSAALEKVYQVVSI